MSDEPGGFSNGYTAMSVEIWIIWLHLERRAVPVEQWPLGRRHRRGHEAVPVRSGGLSGRQRDGPGRAQYGVDGRGRAEQCRGRPGRRRAGSEREAVRFRIFHATGKLPPSTPHGQLPHPGVRTVCAAGRALVGFILAQPGSHRRSSVSRHNDRPHNDFPRIGSSYRSAQSPVSNGARFFRIPLFWVHLRYHHPICSGALLHQVRLR
uniref:(northern house mosquito) hypothetical protein n=1 Tax=Culex pipiens TaxID=7175 RepID=A0A8D8FS17_CULPI